MSNNVKGHRTRYHLRQWLLNLSDLEFDFQDYSKSNNRPAELPIQDFLLGQPVTWPNSAILQDIRFQTPSNLDFDLSMSLKFKSEAAVGLIRFPTGV